MEQSIILQKLREHRDYLVSSFSELENQVAQESLINHERWEQGHPKNPELDCTNIVYIKEAYKGCLRTLYSFFPESILDKINLEEKLKKYKDYIKSKLDTWKNTPQGEEDLQALAYCKVYKDVLDNFDK